jgi:hypothetical protein
MEPVPKRLRLTQDWALGSIGLVRFDLSAAARLVRLK